MHRESLCVYVEFARWCPCLFAMVAVLHGCSPDTASVETQASKDSCGDEVAAASPRLVHPSVCPVERDNGAGKVWHEAYLMEHAASTHDVTIWLRGDMFPELPGCQDEQLEPACPERDAALVERQALNVQQLRCLEEALQGFGEVIPVWYEQPHRLESGHPVPVGIAFTTALSSEQIAEAASHPYVVAIEPPPGGAAATAGILAPDPPCTCATDTEDADAKLTEFETARGRGRQPAVVDLKPDLLPELPTADVLLEDAEHVLWERTILNRQHLTCIGRALDAVLTGPPLRVDHVAGHVSFSTPPLPPWGAVVATIEGIGTGLTWEEAEALAMHPYVARIRTFPGLQAHEERPGCPTDLVAPIPEVECSDEREEGQSKLAPALERLRSDPGPHEVVVLVAGGATICPLLKCPRPPNPCPERDALFERYRLENMASQRCVRELASSLGGRVFEEEEFTLINGLLALLTWQQIDLLAGHPHVTSIEPNAGEVIPPPVLP